VLAQRDLLDYHAFFLVVGEWSGLFAGLADPPPPPSPSPELFRLSSLRDSRRALYSSFPAEGEVKVEGPPHAGPTKKGSPFKAASSRGHHAQKTMLSAAWGHWRLRRRLLDSVMRNGPISAKDVKRNFQVTSYIDINRIACKVQLIHIDRLYIRIMDESG
jgi:hypothetical protein